MPTIEISYKDLCNLIGKKISLKKLEEEFILMVKGEFEEVDGDQIKLEIADSNRPDLWSVEGVARELQGRLGVRSGIPKYPMKKSGIKILVNNNLKGIRPLTAGAVIRGLKITDDVIKQLVQLQEKVCDTFGRKREQAALGIYDLHKITPPVRYLAVDPTSISFQPLDFPRKINLQQILSQHPKGRDYAHLLEGKNKFPIFIDAKDEVLSFPPIINSDYTGKVTTKTKDLFIESSGFDWNYVLTSLNVIVAALADRGGKLETVDVEINGKTLITPNFSPKTIRLDKDFIAKRIGSSIKEQYIIQLLEQARYDVRKTDDQFIVSYSPYRQDIMHPVDVVEDILIGFGYNNVKPEVPEMATQGKLIKLEQFADKVADSIVGIGAHEVLSYILTNKDNLFKKMDLSEQDVIEVDNPVSKNWSVFRTWIIPSLVEFFSKNTNQEYPQQIFEVGQVVLPNDKAETRAINPIRIAWGLADKDADFTKAKQALDFLLRSFGIKYEIEETDHDSFIPGRTGRVKVKGEEIAYIGELHPNVLESWQLDVPVVMFELNLTELFEISQN